MKILPTVNGTTSNYFARSGWSSSAWRCLSTSLASAYWRRLVGNAGGGGTDDGGFLRTRVIFT